MDSLLRITWMEKGGPTVRTPITKGFGTALISQTAAAYGGTAQMHCTSDGVRWEIAWPICSSNVPVTPDFNLERWADDARSGDPRSGHDGMLTLADKRILVVEDEILIAMEIISNLESEQAVPVGPFSSADAALKAIEANRLDAALLDANLHGKPVDDIAAALTQRNVPFAFVTGYGRDSLPASFRAAPVIAKPFTAERLLDETRRLLSRQLAPVVPLHARPRLDESTS